MPRIPDRYLQSVVFIYPSQALAERGAQAGGSGFVVSFASGIGNGQIRYVVTNQHVIDKGGLWIRLNWAGGMHLVHIPIEDWIPAPEDDDFAVANLLLPPYVVPYALRIGDYPSDDEPLALHRDEAARLRVGLGDEAFMIGRYFAVGGHVTNNPVARFGSIALMPNQNEPIRDGRGKDVEAYLIEMRSHAGFSGSPVFLLIPQNSFRGEFDWIEMDDNTTRFRLLGIDTGHMIDPLPLREKVDGEWKDKPGYRVDHYSDMAIVTPIWKILDLMKRED